MSHELMIKLFDERQVRVVWDDEKEKYYFSIVDVCAVLTDNDYQTARKYWNKLKQRLSEEGFEPVTNCHQLKMQAHDGKQRLTDVADTEGVNNTHKTYWTYRANKTYLTHRTHKPY